MECKLKQNKLDDYNQVFYSNLTHFSLLYQYTCQAGRNVLVSWYFLTSGQERYAIHLFNILKFFSTALSR